MAAPSPSWEGPWLLLLAEPAALSPGTDTVGAAAAPGNPQEFDFFSSSSFLLLSHLYINRPGKSAAE